MDGFIVGEDGPELFIPLSEGAVVKLGSSIPVTREMLADTDTDTVDVQRIIRRRCLDAMHRRLTPWEYPDRNPMPAFVAVPPLDRAQKWIAEARARVAAATTTLRYGVQEHDA